jgi:isopenicillin N synthase-like dioxygenase
MIGRRAVAAYNPRMNPIPVIDVRPLRSGPASEIDAVARAIERACTETGFFTIVGHGIDAVLIERVFVHARLLFALPLAQKLALGTARSGGGCGYEPLREQTLEPGTPPDVKEGFLMGRDPEHNVWPSLPGFRATMEAYAAAMLALARMLLRGMARSLALDDDRFDGFCVEPIATLRLLHYPEQPANPLPGEKGCGAHTDWGAITFLLQDDAGGLQVRGSDGWIDVPPVPGSFVVNIGDMMARWTNGRYRSMLHRVINTSGRARYAVPFFLDGPPSYEVVCLPSCVRAGELPAFGPITVAEHLAEMVRRTYA